MQYKKCKVQNWARKINIACSNFKQAMQEVANDIAGICHMIQDNGSGIHQSFNELAHLDNFCVYYTTADWRNLRTTKPNAVTEQKIT